MKYRNFTELEKNILSEKARNTILNKFSLVKMGSAYDDLYTDCFNKSF